MTELSDEQLYRKPTVAARWNGNLPKSGQDCVLLDCSDSEATVTITRRIAIFRPLIARSPTVKAEAKRLETAMNGELSAGECQLTCELRFGFAERPFRQNGPN